MNITVNKTVSYDVANVKINNIILANDTKGLTIAVPFTWLNPSNDVIRTGNNRYTSSQLISAFQSFGQSFAPIASTLSALIPSGVAGNCSIILSDGSMKAIQGYSGVVDGAPKWISTTLSTPQLSAALAPITLDQISSMITMFTVAATS